MPREPVVSELHKAALDYAERGLAVVPLEFPIVNAQHQTVCSCELRADCREASSHPLLTGEEFEPTTRDVQINVWWARWPHANVGLATERFHAIEVRNRAAMKSLTDALRGERIASGPLIQRSNGAWYALFAPADFEVTGRLPRGVRWIGRGGFVVAPPSQTELGQPDKWMTPRDARGLPPIPPSLERLLTAPALSRPTMKMGLEGH